MTLFRYVLATHQTMSNLTVHIAHIPSTAETSAEQQPAGPTVISNLTHSSRPVLARCYSQPPVNNEAIMPLNTAFHSVKRAVA